VTAVVAFVAAAFFARIPVATASAAIVFSADNLLLLFVFVFAADLRLKARRARSVQDMCVSAFF